MKMRPLGAELLHADRRTEGTQTDMTKLIGAFGNSANASENCSLAVLGTRPLPSQYIWYASYIYVYFSFIVFINVTAYFGNISSHLAQCQVSRASWVHELL